MSAPSLAGEYTPTPTYLPDRGGGTENRRDHLTAHGAGAPCDDPKSLRPARRVLEDGDAVEVIRRRTTRRRRDSPPQRR